MIRVFDIFARPSLLAFVSTGVVLLGLISCGVLGARRRRWEIVSACALALLLCVALALTTASFPTASIFGYSYASRWVSPMGMWTWLILAWSAATLWSPRWAVRWPSQRALAVVSMSAVLIVAVVVAASQGPDSQERLYEPVATVVESLETALPHPGTVRVEGANLQFGSPVTLALRRRGAKVGIAFGVQFGRTYRFDAHTYDQVVEFRRGAVSSRGGRRIAVVEVPPAQPCSPCSSAGRPPTSADGTRAGTSSPRARGGRIRRTMSSLTPKTLGLGLAGPQFLPDDRTPLGASTEVTTSWASTTCRRAARRARGPGDQPGFRAVR